ncbi:MAG: peptide chain release factor N(5)-glutamine methyltransferase, partial [Nitrospinota bacterium]
LLAESSGKNISYLYTYPFEKLSDEAWDKYKSFIFRRSRREPVSYILGKKEFWSLSFSVTPDTLIPRPETEDLVEHVVDFIRSHPKEKSLLRVLDIGTGCGNIPVAIASEIEHIQLFSSDISQQALTIAKNNATRLNFARQIQFIRGNLLTPFKGGLDVIVSNPPYIKTSDLSTLSSDVTAHEPLGALEGGDDGLHFYRKIIESSSVVLNSNGGIFFEVGYNQAEEVADLLQDAGRFTDITTFKDLSGTPRVVRGIT